MSVSNTDKSIIQWFNKRWPGYCKKSWKSNPKANDAWAWVVAANKACEFLKQIRPYLKRKTVRKKVTLALRFQQQKRNARWIKKRELYKQVQIHFFMEMKKLNKRGMEDNA